MFSQVIGGKCLVWISKFLYQNQQSSTKTLLWLKAVQTHFFVVKLKMSVKMDILGNSWQFSDLEFVVEKEFVLIQQIKSEPDVFLLDA